ncbi:MAG: FHA domain-containing protein, partial [Frankiales bacterium]|nr:FHA domain-containing protein [Frankiales bacterium]
AEASADPASGAYHQPTASSIGPTQPRLVIPGNPERVVSLTRPVTVIGRGADADLRLPDTGVSRAHAELRLTEGGVRLVDLDSTNGTVVNGRRVRESDLADGDRLDIGATSLTFRSAGEQ